MWPADQSRQLNQQFCGQFKFEKSFTLADICSVLLPLIVAKAISAANLFTHSMGNQKNTQKKKKNPKPGKCKSKKEDVARDSTTPPPQSKPIPKVNLRVSQPNKGEPQTSLVSSNKEDDAAAALMAMGSKKPLHSSRPEFEKEMDYIFRSTIPGMDNIDLSQIIEGEEISKNYDSDSGSSSDSESSDSDDSDTVLDSQ
ncbi:hypothetical protein B0H17DRAFT_1147859 [Mycena rosella]|uniref:Uncharacterized protein n=1 Tax=Mycena rosella TaxID=1033263 RepID=A0AAD7CHA8_MYCRO|nr:hypothetical protein B0H17DRAFT_1147859 [Mycena rosella]